MKASLRSFLFAAAILLSPLAFGQSATDENEGSRLEADGANGIYRFKWFGKTGRTYFIQHTEDLVSWNWVPVIESGDDSVKEWGFTTTGTKFFARLKYWTDPTSDPEGDDFDQDGVPNLYEVQHGNNPFGIEDSNSDGLPDGWLDVHAGTFAIYPPTRLITSLSRNQTAPGKIYLNNDTDQAVNYAVSVSSNTGPNYSVEDSLTGTAIYQWEDISSTGTKLNTISNAWNGYETVSLSGFTFPFYGQNYSQVSVGVNGILTFGAPTYDDSNYPIPTYGYGPSNLIAPLWADLETETAGDIYYKEETNRLIVQYQNVTPAYQTGNYSFQVILYSDGRIEFQYQNLTGASDSCTVGIEDATQTLGTQLAYYSAYLVNNMAVAFLPTSNFFTISPSSGIVSARSRTTLDGLFHSLQLPFGNYTASISVTHNGGGASPVNIAANLTVKNVPPVVAIVYPTHQETLLEGQSVNVTATAVDEDSEIVKVEFYDNNVKLGEDLYSTYQYTWTNLVPGPHVLTAIATDVHGVSVTSAVLAIQVHADSDHDNMPDDWESTNGLDITKNDSMEDLDGDRIPNIFEYSRGTAPNDSASIPETDFVVDPANGNVSTEDKIYSTIAEALSAANGSSWNSQTLQEERPFGWAVIEIKAGVYEEEVFISGVPVLLLAELGSLQGPVEIHSPGYSGVAMYSPSALDGFVISHKQGIEGPGVYSSSTGTANPNRLLTNCIIRGNKASYGGGIFNEGTASLRIVHCTITGNEATGQGRAIYNFSEATINVANSIIWGNAGSATEEIYRQTDEPGAVFNGGATSIIKDGEQGGINENPLLNPSGFLLHNSPAINRAATVLAKASKVDIHGELRDQNGTPDLGADEYRDDNGVNDGDGLPDWAEMTGASGSTDDADGDTIANLTEYEAGWNPRSVDSDHDSLPDGWEWTNFGTAGVLGGDDPDGDGLTNLQEYQQGTDPNNYYSQGGATITPTLIMAGNNQQGYAGRYLTDPLSVEVRNGINGPLLINAPVVFAVSSGNGGGLAHGTDTNYPEATLTVRSGTDGTARAFFMQPDTVSTSSSITAVAGASTVTFGTVTNDQLPANPPSKMTKTVNPDGSTDLNWQDNSNNETEFIIQRQRPDGTWENIGTVTPNTTTFHIPAPQ